MRSGRSQEPIVTGDFTGNGRTDLAAANYGRQHDVGAARQRRRHVPAPGHLRGGSGPDAMVAGDFNGDGRLDLAVANSTTSWTRHRIGAAGQRRRHVPAPGHLRSRVEARRHRGRGLQRQRPTRPRRRRRYPEARCQCCWAMATGRSSPRSLTRSGRPVLIVAGDFNGDGRTSTSPSRTRMARPDPAGQRRRHLPAREVTYRGGNRPVLWWPGTSTATATSTSPSPTSNNTVSVLLGNGDGTFQPQVTYAVGSTTAHRGG